MRETEIEKKIVAEAKKKGGIALKLVCPGFDGIPDRLLLMPEGIAVFIEVKAPGKKPRPLQISRHELLRELGFKVFIIDGAEQIGEMFDEIRST